MTAIVEAKATSLTCDAERGLISQLMGPMDRQLQLMKASGTQAEVRSLSNQLNAELELPSLKGIATAIESLQAVYPHDKRDELQQRVMVRAWTEVLGDIPQKVINEAVRQWLRRDTHFMPAPGELRALCEPILFEKRALARRALVMANADLSAIPEPREVSEEERRENSAKLTELLGTLRGKK